MSFRLSLDWKSTIMFAEAALCLSVEAKQKARKDPQLVPIRHMNGWWGGDNQQAKASKKVDATTC